MYHAKSAGRNNYQFFTERMNQLVSEKHTLGTELRHALERNELILYFQPVMKTPSLKTESIEVLLRWHHPKYGLVLPSKFITLAEDSGLIIPIGKWIFRTACLQIKRWQRLGYQVPRLSINISARQFRDKLLIDNIAHILEETVVDARFISLEITESMIVDNVDKTIQTLNQLNKMGLEIAIDDFGTGYSSLSYLKRFPIKTLKIDRAFVRDIITDPSDNAIVSAIIAMTNSLEMNVIAEGVETEDQLNLLAKHGCNRFQGNYFSKPLPATEIVNYLDKQQIYLVENTRQAR
jgi:EAL domain-containing protein (putative c-di-GMP-specific phosphodiesterase class I)